MDQKHIQFYNLLNNVDDYNSLDSGSIVRRTGNGKDQQGCFYRVDDNGGIILLNVLDLNEGTLAANEGVLRLKEDDRLYRYTSSFRESRNAARAMEIIREWPLYKKNENLQDAIINFVMMSYVPEQLLEMKKYENMSLLFVPIQQKFRIGRFTERRNWDRVAKEMFRDWLEGLYDGEHITYVAQMMQQKSYTPKFFSAGTKPHIETETILMQEPYNFRPTHGGHIKAGKPRNGKKHFIVDAGSNYLGRGVKTPMHVVKKVTDSLKARYPDYDFTPVEGRGAFGTEQSY